MDDFRVIFRVLDTLRQAMSDDPEEFDENSIAPAAVSARNDNQWAAVIRMLSESGFIRGVNIKRSGDGDMILSANNPAITLKGLEYLQTNQLMQTAAYIEKAVSGSYKAE